MKKKDKYDKFLEDLRKKKNKKYDDLLENINYQFSGQAFIDWLKKALEKDKKKMRELKESIPEVEKFIKKLEMKRDNKKFFNRNIEK